jgi:hypothetical protein
MSAEFYVIRWWLAQEAEDARLGASRRIKNSKSEILQPSENMVIWRKL